MCNQFKYFRRKDILIIHRSSEVQCYICDQTLKVTTIVLSRRIHITNVWQNVWFLSLFLLIYPAVYIFLWIDCSLHFASAFTWLVIFIDAIPTLRLHISLVVCRTPFPWVHMSSVLLFYICYYGSLILKLILKNRIGGCGLDLSGTG